MSGAQGVGGIIRAWRGRRRMSQQALALDAEVSTRHLSCVETGKARPSREMLLVLASALELPLRERNALLVAGGFAPAYAQRGLDHPEMADVRRALDFLLERHEPYPAVVQDAAWRVLRGNKAHHRTTRWLLGRDPGHGWSMLEALFDAAGYRPWIVNWAEAAHLLTARVARQALSDPGAAALLDRLLAYPGVPEAWRRPPLEHPSLLVPLHIAKDGLEVRLFTTLTTLGTPTDVTLAELRVETFFPADAASDQIMRALAEAD